MVAYQDKQTGLWKWGKRGNPIYETKAQAERAGIDIITNKLREIKEKHQNALLNHGRV